MQHFNITVSGKVQGVWYRGSTQATAKQLGIYGYVKNCKNGDVFIEAEASEDKLLQLIKWCKIGPERATVTGINYSKGELKGFKNFKIKRF